MDRVWVAVESAVQDALREQAVLAEPPTSSDDWMWLSATITDHVCASLHADVYQAYRARLSASGPPPDIDFDITCRVVLPMASQADEADQL